MYCVFISNCELRALPRTRTILDRYAQRIGDRAWATGITSAALEEVHAALRKRGTRQTSVACYRNDSTLGLRLVWIVGNKNAYDKNGWYAVATRRKKKEFPMPFRHAALIAALSGYTHDLGKATIPFQDKLEMSTKGEIERKKDNIRHEWLSAWLLKRMLQEGAPINKDSLDKAWVYMREREGKTDYAGDRLKRPVDKLESALDSVIMAVCSHHGAMGGSLFNESSLNGTRHIPLVAEGDMRKFSVLDFLKQAPLVAPKFVAESTDALKSDAQRWSELMMRIEQCKDRLLKIERKEPYWEGVMLLARAALIFADHKVSSRTFDGDRDGIGLFANTKKNDEPLSPISSRLKKPKKLPPRYLDQPLSWHLLKVGEEAGENMRMFTGDGLPSVDPAIINHILQPTAHKNFLWQNDAVDYITNLQGGKLVFNVASTGAGKTLANLKIAFAMRPDNARLAVAFNLRSLTKQTFMAFRKHAYGAGVELFDRDFACLMGDSGSVNVDFSKEDEDDVDYVEPVDIEGAATLEIPEWLSRIAQDKKGLDGKLTRLIASPVLISTMDWIVAAGEPGRQARHAKAMIRVTTSDLILDEVDSYDVRASVAIMRVVKTAASFGRNVIVSSATLSPVLAHGIATAYSAGRAVYNAMFGEQEWHMAMVSDAFCPSGIIAPDADKIKVFYQDKMQEMCGELLKRKVTKKFKIADVGDDEASFYSTIAESAIWLHENHGATPSGLSCRLSIGLIRVANVETCMDVSEHLRKDSSFVVTAYHAKDIAERRHAKEVLLDKILSRSDDAWIEELIKAETWIKDATGDVRLIVVATPVEEVGRDHDFDWAVIEPSSMHSILQTAGRVNRHRRRGVTEVNIILLSRNAKSLKKDNDPVFVHPGLELGDSHPSHDLHTLMTAYSGSEESVTDGMLDARLIFDTLLKTKFAQFDENSILRMIEDALPIINRNEGFQMHFMMKKFAEEFPLRDNKMRYFCEVNLNTGKFNHTNNPTEPAGKIEYLHKTGKDNKIWLTADMEDLCRQQESHCVHFSSTVYNNEFPIKIVINWNGCLAL